MATCFGLSYLKPSSGLEDTEFRYVKCAPNGIPLCYRVYRKTKII